MTKPKTKWIRCRVSSATWQILNEYEDGVGKAIDAAVLKWIGRSHVRGGLHKLGEVPLTANTKAWPNLAELTRGL